MAISDSQKVDYLWKKLGYSAAKSDTNANKKAPNEAIASPLLMRADKLWNQASDIPGVLPGSSSAPVTVYPTSAPQECTVDATATANRTWKTGVTDWISPEFGSTYQVKVYIHTSSDAAGASGGDQVFATGSGNDDEWFFDYQAGVLHFIGTNLPNGISFTGKSVYISGGRYTGEFGIGTVTDANISGGNVSANISGNIDGGYGVFSSNVSAPWFIGDLDANIGTFDTSLYAAEATIGSNTAFTDSSATIQYLTIEGETITSTNEHVTISPNTSGANNVVKIGGVTALDVPTGNTAQRPADADAGYIRFNTTLGTLEWYTGIAWASGSQGITQQTITPDGSSATYTLNQEATADSLLVSINGTSQNPDTAYSVSGTDITFTETPLTTDIIDVRFLAVAVAAAGLDDVLEDTSPQLGGNLDLNSSNIVGTGNIDIAGSANVSILTYIPRVTYWDLSGDFSISSSSVTENWQKVTSGMYYNDTGITYSSGTFTFTEAGIYRINVTLELSGGTGEYCSYQFRKNTTAYGPSHIIRQVTRSANGGSQSFATRVMEVSANDTFDIYIDGASGGSLDATYTLLEFEKIG